MASGIPASQAEGLLDGTGAINHATLNNFTVAVYGDAVDDQGIDATFLGDKAQTHTLAGFDTKTTHSIESAATHQASAGTGTVGVVADYVFDLPDTTIATAATSSLAKDLLIGHDANQDGTLATTDNIWAWFDLTSPPTPNGENITVQWHTSGIYQFAA